MTQSSGTSLRLSSCTWRLQTSAARCAAAPAASHGATARPVVGITCAASIFSICRSSPSSPVCEVLSAGLASSSPVMSALACRRSRSTGRERSAARTAHCLTAEMACWALRRQSTIAVWTCREDLSRVRPARTFADMRGVETSAISFGATLCLSLTDPRSSDDQLAAFLCVV
jgi:hypothetical protein